MMTACTPEKENNYLLWIIYIIKNDSFIYKSQEHTNVQINVNIPFLYFAASNCRYWCFGGIFIVNQRQRRVRLFLGISWCQHRLFKKFRQHFFDFTDVRPEWFLAKTYCAVYIVSMSYQYKNPSKPVGQVKSAHHHLINK
jgi:hypothetical protein